jgi:hypothetical protein
LCTRNFAWDLHVYYNSLTSLCQESANIIQALETESVPLFCTESIPRWKKGVILLNCVDSPWPSRLFKYRIMEVRLCWRVCVCNVLCTRVWNVNGVKSRKCLHVAFRLEKKFNFLLLYPLFHNVCNRKGLKSNKFVCLDLLSVDLNATH